MNTMNCQYLVLWAYFRENISLFGIIHLKNQWGYSLVSFWEPFVVIYLSKDAINSKILNLLSCVEVSKMNYYYVYPAC